MDHATVLYDEDCGFCRWSADRLRALDRRGTLRFAAIQSGTGERLLEPVPAELRLASWHLVTGDGRVWSAGAAWPEVLRRLPYGAAFAPVFEACPRQTERAYAWIARHRGRLGAILGQRACTVDPTDMSPARSE